MLPPLIRGPSLGVVVAVEAALLFVPIALVCAWQVYIQRAVAFPVLALVLFVVLAAELPAILLVVLLVLLVKQGC